MKDKNEKQNVPEDINELVTKLAIATTAQNANVEVQPDSNVQLTNKIVDTLFDMVDMTKRKMLGILNARQVTGIKKLYLVNDIIFDNKQSILTRVIDNEIALSVSEHGKGRDQLVKLSKVDDPMEQAGRFSKYLKG